MSFQTFLTLSINIQLPVQLRLVALLLCGVHCTLTSTLNLLIRLLFGGPKICHTL